MISDDPAPSQDSTSPHGGSEGFSPRRRRSPAARRGAGPDLVAALTTLRAAGFSVLVAGSRSVRWLTVQDVATRLSVSPITIRRLIDRGEIGPVLRWSTELRVSERGVTAWESAHTHGLEPVERQERKGA
jgi:excisionase family DNA binding protein